MSVSERRPLAIMTASDLAELLQVSEATLERMRAAGTGPTWFSVNRAVRYRAADVARWIEARLGK